MSKRFRRARLAIQTLEDRAVPAAGDLDVTFSTDGKATAGLTTVGLTGEDVRGMAVDSQGRMLLAGIMGAGPDAPRFGVLRLNPDGTLDPTFGDNGKAVATFGNLFDFAKAVAVDSQDRVIVAGETHVSGGPVFAVARFTAVGVLDTTFGGDGLVTVQAAASGGYSQADAVAIAPDGKVVLAGSASTAFGALDFAVVRLKPDGSPDITFDSDGIAVFGSFSDDAAHAVAVQQDGKVVVGGVTFSFNPDFGLARLNENGSVDTSFGTGGFIQDSYGFQDERVYALAIDPAGNILAGGEMIPGFNYRDFALARYTPAGQPDTTFGIDYGGDGTKDGKLNTEFGGGPFTETSEQIHALALQPDGKIVAAGEYSDGLVAHFAVARYLADGTLDATFGRDFDNNGTPDGKQTIDFGASEDWGEGVAVLPGGKVLVGGYTNNNNSDAAVARLNPDGTLDDTFGAGGRVSVNHGEFDIPNDDLGRAVAVQPDGKVIVAGRTGASGFGDFGLSRFNRNGTLDTSFGNAGSIQTEMGFFDTLNVLLLQPDGKVLAIGESNDGFALARYTADGHLDTSFDGDGKVITELGDFMADGATAAALMPDGRIVLAGYAGTELGVARYLPNGRLDRTFDFDGKTTDPNSQFVPAGVAVQADGKILVAGPGQVLRFRAAGGLDPTFGTGGVVQPNIGAEAQVRGLAVRPDGRIVVFGSGAGASGGTDDFALTQLLPSGAPDPAFNGGSFVQTDFGQRTDIPAAIRLQADGKIVLAGNSRWSGAPTEYALARYLANGNLDATFGTGGRVTGQLGDETDVAALALHASGKLTVAGSVQGPDSLDFAVAQFRGDNTPPVTPGIPDLDVNEDAIPRSYDLRALFSDAQDTDEELTFEVLNTNPALVSASLDGSDVLTLTFQPHKYGTATITVRVTDIDGAVTTEPFVVTVASVNDLPVVVNDDVNTTDQAAVTVNVLANDTDADTANPPPDTDVLTLVSVTGATKGTVAFQANGQVQYTPNVNAHGDEVLTYTVADRFGATATGTLTIHLTDVTAPTVKEVRLYYGPKRFETLFDRPTVFGWSNVRKVEMKFSEAVSVQQTDLALTGLGGAYTFASFNYNATTFTATWTLSAPIGIDRLQMTLDGTSPTGVSDATAGNLIGSNTLRSFGVLPGDLDGNGLVTATEAGLVKKNIGKRYPNPRTADVNGDGTVTMADYLIVKGNVGKRV